MVDECSGGGGGRFARKPKRAPRGQTAAQTGGVCGGAGGSAPAGRPRGRPPASQRGRRQRSPSRRWLGCHRHEAFGRPGSWTVERPPWLAGSGGLARTLAEQNTGNALSAGSSAQRAGNSCGGPGARADSSCPVQAPPSSSRFKIELAAWGHPASQDPSHSSQSSHGTSEQGTQPEHNDEKSKKCNAVGFPCGFLPHHYTSLLL